MTGLGGLLPGGFARMTSDADCTRAGWIEYLAFGGAFELHLSVPPNTDLDGCRVAAFDHDEQEMIAVSGHLFVWERVTSEGASAAAGLLS